ncbi:MAG: hypothetical protein NTZ27_02415 [Ignavibacteriales bacterium]|nr:hypothetical protein [Ignavibacteriales bacterium]
MNSNIKSLLLTAVFGFVVCILLGLLFFGTAIFNFRYPVSVIVLSGFYGAIFFSVLKYQKKKEQFLTAFVILILDLLLQGKSITTKFLIRDIIFIASLLSSILCYKLFINKYNSLPLFIRSLSLPLLLGLFNILATLILILIFNPSAMKIDSAIFLNAKFAAFIGLGLGIGFDLFEKLKTKII